MGVHLVRGRQREQWRERGSRLLELEQHGLERERELRVSDLLPHTHNIVGYTRCAEPHPLVKKRFCAPKGATTLPLVGAQLKAGGKGSKERWAE